MNFELFLHLGGTPSKGKPQYQTFFIKNLGMLHFILGPSIFMAWLRLVSYFSLSFLDPDAHYKVVPKAVIPSDLGFGVLKALVLGLPMSSELGYLSGLASWVATTKPSSPFSFSFGFISRKDLSPSPLVTITYYVLVLDLAIIGFFVLSLQFEIFFDGWSSSGRWNRPIRATYYVLMLDLGIFRFFCT